MTCWIQWTIETNGEEELGKSVLAARHNDGDLYIYIYIYMCVCVYVYVLGYIKKL